MSSGVTNGKKEKSKVFEMILCSPGMTESCKISLKITRQNTLLLSRLIETGILNSKSTLEDEILDALPEASVAEFKTIYEEILTKAGLTDFYEKLKSL
ncbi:MAG: hypothetical protein J0L56_09070 [Chitinophagales bacterium]|nr:hypothetical protein [Chitinophagales bacterium]